MAVLSQAVRDTVAGNLQAQQALEAVAKQWQAIHERMGVASQTSAYARSIGIDL